MFISDFKDLVVSIIAYCMATYVMAAVAHSFIACSGQVILVVPKETGTRRETS
ncbi:MAG: hypothetical protein ACJ70U_08680 [Nitrososphaera sp.]|jgi:hypothetical protein